MTGKIFWLLLFFAPFIAAAQSSSGWQLYLNKTKLLSASTDSTVSVQLQALKNSTLTFDFSERDTSFKRSVLVMNESRTTVQQKEMMGTCKTASFTIADLLAKTNRKPFTVYVVDIPTDPAKAMLVRVAPVPICNFTWQ